MTLVLFLGDKVDEISKENFSRIWICFASFLKMCVFTDEGTSERGCPNGARASAIASDHGYQGAEFTLESDSAPSAKSGGVVDW